MFHMMTFVVHGVDVGGGDGDGDGAGDGDGDRRFDFGRQTHNTT